MLLIARLLLRQDEAISVMRQSTGFVLWVRTTPSVIIPKIVGVAKVWKEQTTKADSTQSGTAVHTALHPAVDHVASMPSVCGSDLQGGGNQAACNPAGLAQEPGPVGLSDMGSRQQGAQDRRREGADGSRGSPHTTQGAQIPGNTDTISRFHATKPIRSFAPSTP